MNYSLFDDVVFLGERLAWGGVLGVDFWRESFEGGGDALGCGNSLCDSRER